MIAATADQKSSRPHFHAFHISCQLCLGAKRDFCSIDLGRNPDPVLRRAWHPRRIRPRRGWYGCWSRLSSSSSGRPSRAYPWSDQIKTGVRMVQSCLKLLKRMEVFVGFITCLAMYLHYIYKIIEIERKKRRQEGRKVRKAERNGCPFIHLASKSPIKFTSIHSACQKPSKNWNWNSTQSIYVTILAFTPKK